MNTLKYLGIGIILLLLTSISQADPDEESTTNVNGSTPSIPPALAAPPADDSEESLGDIIEPEDMPFEEMIGPIVLVDELPTQVLTLLSNLTGKSIILNEKIPSAKINFTSSTPLTINETITALESALAVNGIALTPIGDKFLKAIPANTAKAQSPELLMGSPLEIPATQKIYTKIFDIKYLTPSELRSPITPLLTPGAYIFAPFNKSNTLLITDTAVNLQTVQHLLNKIDNPFMLQDKIHFYTLKNTSAVEVQKRLTQLQKADVIKNNVKGGMTIEADGLTNQLIVVTHEDNKPFIENLIKQLDVNVEPFTQSKVFSIKYAEAIKVAELIQKIIDNQKKISAEKNDTKPQAKPTLANNNNTQSSEGLQFSDYITVIADERSNAIVAYGSKPDLDQVEKFINDIDVLLAQVRIEVVIAEVTLTKDITQGIEAFGFNLDASKTPQLSIGGAKRIGSGSSDPGSFSISHKIDGGFNLKLAIEAARTNSDISILSSPTIVTTHNQDAYIQITEQRPIVKGQLTDAKTDDSSSSAIKSTVEYKSIGIKLNIKPLIGSDGIIQLKIKQVVDEILEETANIGGNVSQPIIANREAESFVSLANKEVLVLGGLQKITKTKTKKKLAFIGDLPLIGSLLGTSKARKGEKKELIIFIKPYILNSVDDIKTDAERMISNLDETGKDVKEFYETGKFDDTQIKNLDQRKRKKRQGLLSKLSSKNKKGRKRHHH